MLNRRKFLGSSILSAAALLTNNKKTGIGNHHMPINKPLVIATWGQNVKANAEHTISVNALFFRFISNGLFKE